jgi:hypothetical protein
LTDPGKLVRRAEAGETIVDTSSEGGSIEEKIGPLAEMLCRGGEESAVGLLVLMATLENSADPKALAHTAKHLAFTRCGELNAYGIVDSQIAALESELLT